ncbi:MAG: hypothetical protein QM790_17050 [Nibricoccus sp.]
MATNVDLIKLSCCGPNDVLKEIEIVREVVTEWNLRNGEARGFWIKSQHWSSDSHPEMGDRPQAIINRQMLDASDIVVAIFWGRFGMPTGIAASGTEEEIRRATRLGKKVMVYFSDLEAVSKPIDQVQSDLLWQFRRKLRDEGLCGNFSSRTQFRQDFARHLSHALNELRPVPTQPSQVLTQSINGDGNIQVGGDYNVLYRPPELKTVVERRVGAISSAEARQIQLWIEELAESSIGVSRKAAFGMWWKRFKNRFEVEKYEELLSSKMENVRSWFCEQRAIQKRELRTKLPGEWQTNRIIAIKAAMRSMGKSNELYYPQISQRLRMKKPFTSLKELTKKDLERVYTLVLRDAKGV